MRLPHILTIPLLALGLFSGVALGDFPQSTDDPSLVCVVDIPGCSGEVATIKIVQTEEETIITVELCGESYTTSVPSNSSGPISGTLTCCATGEKITPTGTLASSSSTWGEVDDCEDFILS